jgi:hypothetical protein
MDPRCSRCILTRASYCVPCRARYPHSPLVRFHVVLPPVSFPSLALRIDSLVQPSQYQLYQCLSVGSFTSSSRDVSLIFQSGCSFDYLSSASFSSSVLGRLLCFHISHVRSETDMASPVLATYVLQITVGGQDFNHGNVHALQT